MISIKTMAGPHTNIILSGDPKQLGPIVRSGVAQDLGLSTSYLERLMKREVYNDRRKCGITCVFFFLSFSQFRAMESYQLAPSLIVS